MTNNAEANISTEQPSPREDARLSATNGNQERASGLEETQGEGAQASDAVPLLSSAGQQEVQEALARLRKPLEFKLVYARGTRYDARLLTVFVLCQGLSHHRLGITASRKACGIAVKRNRAKRLLRESFRLCKQELAGLRGRYDWVLNAKRALPDLKLNEVLEELRTVVERVSIDEARTNNPL